MPALSCRKIQLWLALTAAKDFFALQILTDAAREAKRTRNLPGRMTSRSCLRGYSGLGRMCCFNLV
jgi:hypothetical protein